MYGAFKIAGFLSFIGGIFVLGGDFIGSLKDYPLVLIGGVLAVISGLFSMFKRVY